MINFNYFKKLSPDNKFRLFVYPLLLTTIIVAFFAWQEIKTNSQKYIQEQEGQFQLSEFNRILPKYKEIKNKIKDYQSKGVDVAEATKNLDIVRQYLLFNQNYPEAEKLLTATNVLLDQRLAKKVEADRLAEETRKKAEEEAARLRAEEEAKKRGTLSGKVLEGTSLLAGTTISLISGKTTIAKTKSDSSGNYAIVYQEGKYTLSATLTGFNNFRQYNVTIIAQQTVVVDIGMTRVAPVPQSGGGDSTSYSNYSRVTVNTSRGNFLIDQMTFNLASGHIKIMTDTANDEDCTNQCAVKSLADFVNTGGGWHGINGTYFCPADYAGCAGEVNSFFWKIYNSRLGKMINEKNGLGEWEPFLAFDSGGQARYFSRWDQRGSYPNYAGINSKPALVSGGRNVLNENDLDTKQLTVKSNRGALGLKGDSLYAVIAKGATVIDLAAIMESLGMDYALNIDGGGSSAMIYKGSYKVGPGRGIPNALIVVEK